MKIKSITRNLFFALLSILTLFIIFSSLWLFQTQKNIKKRIESGWFLPPVEYYAAPEKFFLKKKVKRDELKIQFEKRQLREREEEQKFWPGDYTFLSQIFCLEKIEKLSPELKLEVTLEDSFYCALFQDKNDPSPSLIIIHNENYILELLKGTPLHSVSQVQLSPLLFAQYFGTKPMLRKPVQLSETPLFCLQSITAIEDHDFLNHKGVSPTGILRAFLQNLIQGRKAQGGSTITQQLVKNYFLTPERTYKRKIKEIFIALLLELQVDKDEILRNYLNVIYMGQNGPFEVRGFASASQYYFSKPLKNLSLNECALLAAIVNSPGRFNPYRHPENALTRRNKVLTDMKKYEMIDESAFEKALKTPLPSKPPQILKDPAPYFLNSIHQKLVDLSIDMSEGLKVYTTLNPQAQYFAHNAIEEGIAQIEKNYKYISKEKEKGNLLQASLVSLDLNTGEILALIGGRSFRQTQYNRIAYTKRQVGSIMKPFVYLTALESLTETGEKFSPLTELIDEPFKHKFENQVWEPKNYDNTFRGKVPLFYALKNSLNVPTAKVAVQVGASAIIDTASRLGVETSLKPYPSIALGAFELSAEEILQSYSTIARLGSYLPNFMISKVTSLDHKVIFENKAQPELRFAPETVSVLVGMMKNTIENGTGQGVRSRGFLYPAAGKTGTTSETKDAWFVGFTPDILTLVWVGYDDNTPTKLTGASGAVPIWTHFMKDFAVSYPERDFNWPEFVKERTLGREELSHLTPGVDIDKLPESLKLIFNH